MTPPSVTLTRQPCTCTDETLCLTCPGDCVTKRPGTTAQQRYYYRNRAKCLAYAKRYRAGHPQPQQIRASRHDTSWRTETIPATLVASALSGIPGRWRDADEFGDGAYLWHCEAWQKIDALPHVCPGCGTHFFEKENAA